MPEKEVKMSDKLGDQISKSSIDLNLKDLEEAKLFAAQRISLNRKHYFDVIRYILMLVGIVILFLIIQRPESYLKIKSSKEEILRERAKMVLELLKENDPDKISLGIEAIEAAYPTDDNNWLNKFKVSLVRQSNHEKIKNALDKYTKLTKENENYIKELNLLKKMVPPTQNTPDEETIPESDDPGPVIILPESNEQIDSLTEPYIPEINEGDPLEKKIKKMNPIEIKGRIQELDRQVKVNEYIIGEQKLFLESFGITLNDTKDWEGKWYISWEADYQIFYEKKPINSPLTFEINNGRLMGFYSFPFKKEIIKGEIRNIQIDKNCLKGRYYEKGTKGEAGEGIVEFLMFPQEKDAFIGRYKRLKSNFVAVDSYYKIWVGKRKKSEK